MNEPRVGNGYGPLTKHISRERDLAVFDQLPPEVRHAMKYGVFNRCALEVSIQVQRLGGKRVAELLPVADAKVILDERSNA